MSFSVPGEPTESCSPPAPPSQIPSILTPEIPLPVSTDLTQPLPWPPVVDTRLLLEVLKRNKPVPPIRKTPGVKMERELVWAEATLQGRKTWTLVDTGSVANIINTKFYYSLPSHPPPLPPDPTENLVSGHNTALPIVGRVVLAFTFSGHTYYHIFQIINNFPVNLCLGSEFLSAHGCTVQYGCHPPFSVTTQVCQSCTSNALSYGRTPSGSAKTRNNIPLAPAELVAPVLRAPRSSSPHTQWALPSMPAGHSPLSFLAEDPPINVRFMSIAELEACDPGPLLGEDREEDFQLPPEIVAEMEKDTETPYPRIIPRPPGYPYRKNPLTPPELKVIGELSLDQADLSSHERTRLERIIRQHCTTFAQSDFDLGQTPLLEHTINTQGLPPFKIKCRPIPYKAMDWLKQEIDRLLKTGVIRHSQSPYSSPVVIVPKKSKPGEPPKFRLCVDYRWLNEQTKKDAYPIPRIQELLPRLARARFFSSLDLVSGYHQVPMAKEAVEKTAFSTPFGHFEYNMMPFGMTNAPATFQRLMNHIFADRLDKDVLAYLDDIIIFSETYEDHLASLHMALSRLQDAGLKCQPSKCQLFRTSLTYLGHTVSTEGVAPEARKLEVLKSWPTPKTGVEMMSFLGFCNYYRALVPRFADLAVPLYPLGQHPQIDWNPALLQSFEALRTALLVAPILRLPDPNKPFILETDASSVAVGAVLKQSDSQGEYPVALYSMALSRPERNYSAYERELLALVKAVSHFGVYLLYSEFTWRTDHAALRNLFRADLKLSSRVSRWILALQPYSIKIELLKGKLNTVADALSRINTEGLHWSLVDPEPRVPELGYGTLQGLVAPSPVRSFEDPYYLSASECFYSLESLSLPVQGQPVPLKPDDMKKAQEEDPPIRMLRDQVSSGDSHVDPTMSSLHPVYRYLMSDFPKLRFEQAVLVLGDLSDPLHYRIVTPQNLVPRVLEFAHVGPDAAHLGHKRLKEKVSHLYYWPSMKTDIRLFVDSCPACLSFHPASRKAHEPLNPFNPGDKNEIVALDFVGGQSALPVSARGNKVILLMIDLFTKYCVAVPLPDMRAETTALAFEKYWLLAFGPPLQVHSDQGTNFEAALFQELCLLWRIHKSRTTAYHPQGNGACERANRSVLTNLKRLLNEGHFKDWDLYLPQAVYAYNTSVHSATGHTPHFLTFMQEARTPSELIVGPPSPPSLVPAKGTPFDRYLEQAKCYHELRSTLHMTQRRSKAHYDKGACKRLFQPGNTVRIRLVRLHNQPGSKLRPTWSGPQEVLEVRGPLVRIRDTRRQVVQWIHADRLSSPEVPPLMSLNPPVPRFPQTHRRKHDLMSPSPPESEFESVSTQGEFPLYVPPEVAHPEYRTRYGRLTHAPRNTPYLYSLCQLPALPPLLSTSSSSHSMADPRQQQVYPYDRRDTPGQPPPLRVTRQLSGVGTVMPPSQPQSAFTNVSTVAGPPQTPHFMSQQFGSQSRDSSGRTGTSFTQPTAPVWSNPAPGPAPRFPPAYHPSSPYTSFATSAYTPSASQASASQYGAQFSIPPAGPPGAYGTVFPGPSSDTWSQYGSRFAPPGSSQPSPFQQQPAAPAGSGHPLPALWAGAFDCEGRTFVWNRNTGWYMDSIDGTSYPYAYPPNVQPPSAPSFGAPAMPPPRGPPPSLLALPFPEVGTCFRCGQPGHLAARCPRRAADTDRPAPSHSRPSLSKSTTGLASGSGSRPSGSATSSKAPVRKPSGKAAPSGHFPIPSGPLAPLPPVSGSALPIAPADAATTTASQAGVSTSAPASITNRPPSVAQQEEEIWDNQVFVPTTATTTVIAPLSVPLTMSQTPLPTLATRMVTSHTIAPSPTQTSAFHPIELPICTKHNHAGLVVVNSNLSQLIEQASHISQDTPAPPMAAFGVPQSLGPMLDALRDAHTFVIPAEVLYTHLALMRDAYNTRITELESSVASLQEQLAPPADAAPSDNATDNALAGSTGMDVGGMTPNAHDNSFPREPSPLEGDYLSGHASPQPFTDAQAVNPVDSITQPNPIVQPTYVDAPLIQIATPQGPLPLPSLAQMSAPTFSQTQMPVAAATLGQVISIESLPPWVRTILAGGAVPLTDIGMTQWVPQPMAPIPYPSAIPANVTLAPQALPADWLHATPYPLPLPSQTAPVSGTISFPFNPLSVVPATQPVAVSSLPQSTPFLPTTQSSLSSSLGLPSPADGFFGQHPQSPASRRASTDATSSLVSNTASMSLPVNVDTSGSSSANPLVIASAASSPASPLGRLTEESATGPSDDHTYATAQQSPATSTSSLVYTGQNFLVNATFTPQGTAQPTTISVSTSVTPQQITTTVVPASPALLTSVVAVQAAPAVRARRPSTLSAASDVPSSDTAKKLAPTMTPVSDTTSDPTGSATPVAQRLRERAPKSKSKTDVVASGSDDETTNPKKSRGTPVPGENPSEATDTGASAPAPALQRPAKKSTKTAPANAPAPFNYTLKPNLDRRNQFYNQVVECVLHYCPLLAQELEFHVSVAPFPLETCRIGNSENTGFWCPSTLETLTLLMKAPSIPTLSWSELHKMHATWMDAGPVPPIIAMQAYTFTRQSEGGAKANYPFMRVREAFYPDKFDGKRGPLHLIITGPAHLAEVLKELQEMVHLWGLPTGSPLPNLDIRGPEFTADSIELIRRIHAELRIPSLSLAQVTDALFHDPCHLLIGNPRSLPRYSKSKSALEKIINRHGPDYDLNLLRLLPIAPLFDLPYFLKMKPIEAESMLGADLHNDFIPYPLQLLATMPITAERTALLTCMYKYIQETLIPAKKLIPDSPDYPLLSRPARIPDAVQRIRPTLSSKDRPTFNRTTEEQHLVVMDLELGVRKIGDINQNVPIIITLMDRHGHVLFHAGVKPPGGVPYMTKPKITGVTKKDVESFPSFEEVYPFLYRFLSPGTYIIGHGLDADLSALGIRVAACRVFDTSTFLGIRALAIATLKASGLPVPPTLSLTNPNRVGLETLIQSLTGLDFRDPTKPHDSIADCLVTLALFDKVHNEFLDAWETNMPALVSRNVGVGFPIDSVRAVYLPADNLVASPALKFDRNEKPHDPIPSAFQLDAYYNERYLRQPLTWPRPRLSEEAIHRAHQAATRIYANVTNLSDLPKESYDGFAANFARYTDASGESREGPGSMSRPEPDDENDEYVDTSSESPFHRGSALPYCGAPLSVDTVSDCSGVFLVRRSRGTDRLREGYRIATEGEFGVTLPVPVEDWQRIWRPAF